MLINTRYIQSKAASARTYQKGQDYQREQRVHLSETMNGNILAVVRGTGGKKYHVNISFNEKAEIQDAVCDCPAFESYNGYCKHIVATLLEYIKQEPEQPDFAFVPAAAVKQPTVNIRKEKKFVNDPQILGLIERYSKRMAIQALASFSEERAVLEPTLIVDYRYPRLNFRIGTERFYIVKSVSEFVRNMKSNSRVEYGKSLSFVHAVENFEEKSRPLVRFILEQYHEADDSYYRYTYLAGSSDFKRQMFLTPFMLDSFINLCIGMNVITEINYSIGKASVCDENPLLRLSLVQQGKSGFCLMLDRHIQLLRGANRLYVLMNDVLYRCDEAYSEACADFLKVISDNGRQLTLDGDSIKTFTVAVLSKIRPFIPIDSEIDLVGYEPPRLVTRIYLDRLSTGVVTARMVFCYGEEEREAFKPKQITDSADLKGEWYAEGALKKYFTLQPDSAGRMSAVCDEDAAYDLVAGGMEELSSFAEIYTTDAFKNIQIRPATAPTVGVRLASGLLEVEFGLDGYKPAELVDILHSYRKRKKYHRLRDGSFLGLESDSVAKLSELLDGLNLSDKEIGKGTILVPEYRALYLDEMMKRDETVKYERDGEFKKIIRDMKDVSDSDFSVPTPLKSVLRNYQKTGYRWLRTIAYYGFGGILADDMGLGKTLQVIALLLAQKNEGREHCLSLVVCPSSLVLNWESEVARFAPGLNVIPVAGSAAQRAALLENAEKADLLITSYDTLKRDRDCFDKLKFEYEIIDEAQYIKNYGTQNAKAVKEINSRVKFALTGTPVENSLAELWSIYDYLMPGYLFSYGTFRKKLEAPIVSDNDTNAEDKLRKLIRPFILRRLKKDVLKELPEKTETVCYAEMEEEQSKLYWANAALAKEQLAQEMEENGSGEDKLVILALLTKLRMICCDPSLQYEEYAGGSTKLELCMELLENSIAAGHKLLLFSQFTSMLQIIEQRLKKAGIGYFKLTGETKPSERLGMVNTFNTGDIPVFLISLKAGGTGLNLTGADMVIHYDPWWNVSAQNQATDRAHRIGQKNSVQVYKLIVKNTLEEKMMKMQQDKAELADRIIKEGGNAFSKLSRQELLELFD